MRALLLATLAVLACACGSARSQATTVGACRGSDLAASFALVPGSPAAGNVVYALRLRNRAAAACFVSGLLQLRLLGRTGTTLPTHVVAANPGALTAVRAVLGPGGFATASARFSPDVPGPGEQHPGACEPKAYRVRVHAPPGNGWTSTPVKPPTSVCEHGTMQLSALVAGRKPPHV
jgi:hypothetical protein